MRLVSAANYDLPANVVFAPDKQRGGVYGTAQQMASCLTNGPIASMTSGAKALEVQEKMVPPRTLADTPRH